MDNNRNFFLYLIMSGFLLFFAWHILPVAPRDGQVSSCRDTTIYNITYRDTTIYEIERRDSVIVDYTLVPTTDFDTVILRDTTYIAVPVVSYHFSDSISDIWASGYRVTLDSVRYHFREVTKMITTEKIITERPKILTADAGLTLYTGRVLDLDLSAHVRLGKRWSIAGKAGVFTDGKSLTPYAGAGVRYRLR